MINIEISKMKPDDIILIQKDFNLKFDKFWTVHILQEDLENENSRYIVAKHKDEIVGIAGIKIILDEANIMNIVTRVDRRNLGIASSLLSKLINLAQDSKCSTLTLEVNENNLVAIHLYEKFGFERIGLRKKYYNNTDNAIIMTRRITNEK